jgi:hypothetical protein
MKVQPFQWDGRELRTRDDWIDALMTILTRADAVAFMTQIYDWYPGGRGDAEDFVGYITGDVPRPLGVKLRKLLGVTHPLNRDDVDQSVAECLAAGFALSRDARHPPPWLALLMSYPRVNNSVAYRQAEWARAMELAAIVEN